jgi:hypothetical protein
VLKAYSLWLIDPETAITHFREHEEMHRKQLAEHEETNEQICAQKVKISHLQ